ncbi:MAG: hypothetical protein Q9221_008948 [Calogaya cf. arnoldii]
MFIGIKFQVGQSRTNASCPHGQQIYYYYLSSNTSINNQQKTTTFLTMYFQPPFTLPTLLLAFHIPSLLAQTPPNTNCKPKTYIQQQSEQHLLHPNATGSVTRPGSNYNPSSPNSGNWIWHSTISINDKNSTWQSFQVDTTSTLAGVEEKDIPFRVCVKAFTDIPRSTYANVAGQEGTREGSCEPMLSRECVEAMSAKAVKEGGGSCAEWSNGIARDMPGECKGAFGELAPAAVSTSLFKNEKSNQKRKRETDNCANENDKVRDLFGGMELQYSDSTEFNQTVYDEAFYRVTPLLTLVTGDASESPRAELLCLRARDVVSGSRVPPAFVQGTAATVSANNISMDPWGDTPSEAGWNRGLELGGVLASVVVSVILLG